MKLTTPFTALRNVTSDIWRMHDFNYQLPKKEEKNSLAIKLMKDAGWN